MTQRIFDVENEQDTQELWSILPDEVVLIKQKFADGSGLVFFKEQGGALFDEMKIIKINWHGKTEITRPIQEATEADVGKLCCFWNNEYNPNAKIVGCLCTILPLNNFKYAVRGGSNYKHCRRLTKQEIEELC